MKIKNALLRTVLLLSICAAAQAQNIESFLPDYVNSDQYHYRKMQEKVWSGVPQEKQKGWKFIKRWEHFWGQRLYPDGKLSDALEIYSKYQNFDTYKKQNSLESAQWQILGPINSPDGNGNREQGLGRLNVVRFHPQNANEIWVGSASGGVWKTTNKGQNWTTFPFTQFLSLGVSDIAISYSNPNIIYVASGDADGSAGSASAFYSIGLLKTTNGGADWTVTNMQYQMSEGMILYRILVKPNDPNIVLVATSKGMLKSTDGGENWEKVLDGNLRDMEFKPGDFNTQYACTYNRYGDNTIYKSTNAGDSWEAIHTVTGANRIALNVTPANPNMLYALLSSSKSQGFHSFLTIDQTNNSVSVKSEKATSINILGWYGGKNTDTSGQSVYDLCLAISPVDQDFVFTGGIDIYKSTDKGKVWKRASNWFSSSSNYVHADIHDLQFNPLTNEIYSANDGGISYSADGGVTWTDISNGLSIMQFYKMGQSQTNRDLVLGGAQDNGTNLYTPSGWYKLYSSDGMDCGVNPGNNNIIYVSIYNGSFQVSEDGGESFDYMISDYITNEPGGWVTPIALDEANPKNVYVGFQNVWKNSTSGLGYQWTKVSDFNSTSQINFLTVAPSNSNYIYAAKESQLHLTKNGGSTWTQLKSFPKQITSVAVNPTDPNLIYVTLSGFTPNEKVYYFNGTDWSNISGNLPNIPVNTVAYQKNTNDRIYIGTDIGVFYTDRNSNIWTNYNNIVLPNIIVNELEIFYGSNPPRLRAATYGRGIWETVIPASPSSLTVDININKDTIICSNDNFKLTAPQGYDSYLWANGETTREIFPAETGRYSVKAVKGNVEYYSDIYEVTVEVPSNLNITYKEPELLCEGDTLEISGTIGFKKYLWSTGATERKIQITQSGKYFLTGTKNEVCESYSDTLEFTFLPRLPKPVINQTGKVLTISIEASDYQWYKDGELIPDANEKELVINEEGKYYVEVINDNDCATSSDVFQSNLSVEQINSSITVSPNPGSGEFQLILSGKAGNHLQYTLSNITGEELFTFSGFINSNDYKSAVYLVEQPAGVYFLKYNCGTETGIIKIIKK